MQGGGEAYDEEEPHGHKAQHLRNTEWLKYIS